MRVQDERKRRLGVQDEKKEYRMKRMRNKDEKIDSTG